VRSVANRRDSVISVTPPTGSAGPDMVTTAGSPAVVETRRRAGRGWLVAAIGVVVAVFALLVAWAVKSGAVHRAYSDDWAYLRIARRFVTAGTIEGVGWNDTSLLGQLVTSKFLSPVTGSTVAGLRVVSIIAAAGSLVAVALLARRTRSANLWPLLPLTLIAVPGFGSTLATYMTEQLALFVQLLCLSLGLVAWRRWSATGRFPVTWLVAMALAGAWAGSIRQAAVAAPVAVVGALLTHPRAGRRERRLVAAIGAAVVAFVLLLLVVTPLDGPTMAIVRGSVSGQLARIYQAAATVALFLVPVGAVTGWLGRSVRLVRAWWSTARGCFALGGLALVVILGGLLLDRRTGSLLVGNSLQQQGGYQGMDRLAPNLFSAPVWLAVELAAAAALFVFLVLVAHAVRVVAGSWRRGGWRTAVRPFIDATAITRVAAVWVTLSALAALAVNLAYRAIYDRYLIPVIIGLALIAVDNAVAPVLRVRRLTVAAIAFVPLLALGTVSATDTQDLLDLRWAAGDRLVQLDYRADQIDAGFDWVGYHYPGIARPDMISLEPDDYPPATYDAYFPEFRRCAFASPDRITPPPGFSLVGTVQHHRLFGLMSDTMYLYGVARDGGTASCLASGQG
jgi:hypothetical protein